MKTFLITIIAFFSFLMSSAQKYNADPEYDYLVTISTDFGDIKLILFEDTPIHRENYLTLFDKGVFNGVIFHRVINNFMIQAGDLSTKNEPLPDDIKELTSTRIPAEILPNHKHVKGAVAGARQGDHINPYKMSSPTQFYIVQNPNGTPHLDGGYTVFGQVVAGLDVVDKIARVETVRDKPLKDIKMNATVKKVKKEDISKQYNYTY